MDPFTANEIRRLSTVAARSSSKPMTETPTDGWLSPKGKMYSGTLGCHAVYEERFYGHADDPSKAIEQAGWWKLSSFMAVGCPQWIGVCPATLQQREYIIEWCKSWNASTHKHRLSSLVTLKVARLPDFTGIQGANR